MPVVVAMQIAKSGRVQEILDAFAAVSPLVHNEQGCELYAAHTDGDRCIMVERWTTQEDLDAHAAGEPIKELGRLFGDALAKPSEVWVLENVPFGDLHKGTIQ